MTHPDPSEDWSADGPLDDVDLGLLDAIRELFQEIDPMPPDLPGRIRFSLSLRSAEIELARLTDQELSGAGARGTEQSRTITFDSESLTVMIRVNSSEDGTVRVDGWLAPPGRREIELTTAGDPLLVSSDEQGRFAFARVPRGTAQLVVRAGEPGPAGGGVSVVTPALIL
jgi:hypothetical protein